MIRQTLPQPRPTAFILHQSQMTRMGQCWVILLFWTNNSANAAETDRDRIGMISGTNDRDELMVNDESSMRN